MPGPITANPPSNLPKTVYVIPTFLTGEDALRIAYSIDLKRWTPLSDDALFTPGGGNGVRDPQMWFRGGVYYVAFTAGNFGACSYWMIASSVDLVTWSAYATVSMAAVSGANQVWVGCFYVDPATGLEYIFTAVSPNHTSGYTSSKIYSQTPTTPKNYSAWSAPVEVTGTSLPTKIIPLRVAKIGSNYRMFIKDDTSGLSYCMTSTALLSGYTVGSSISWGTAYEGVGLASLGGSSWRAIIDKFSGLGMYYSDSTDNFATWSSPVAVVTNENYSNSDCMPTTDASTIIDLMAGRTSLSPRLTGITIGATRDANLPVHMAPAFGTQGGFNLDSPTNVQMNVNLMRGGTLYSGLVIDGGGTLKVLSWTFSGGAAYVGQWTLSDGTYTQLKGNMALDQIGKTVTIKSGTNAKAGTFTLVAGTVAVANTSVTANSVISCSLKTSSGTPGIYSPQIILSAGVGFTANGLATDASTYNFAILEVN